nr:2-methyl-1,2-propanediol dehydrogenase-like [Nerophis lumbriciformis]
MTRFSSDDASVVVVIGSGASGGVVANQLAQRNRSVVCLEAGRRLGREEIVTDDAEMFGRITWLDQRIGEGNAIPPFPVWNCKTVGGTTMHWTGTSLRMQAHEFKARSTYGQIEGTSVTDWPIDLQELAPYYAMAEDQMGVTGTHGIERLPGNNNYKVLEAGARKLGYQQINTNNVAINSSARNGRPGCLQLGFCTSGCAIGAKWSTYEVDIPQAEATGNFELRTEAMVTRIVHDTNGRVSGVEYLDAAGQRVFQAASAVCVAGNVVETTRLLLNSKSEQFPNGLANSSDQVGRNYMRHVIAGAVGVMPGEVNMHRGTHQAGLISDEAHFDPDRGFFGGILYLTVPFTPEVIARLLIPGSWGPKVTSILDRYKNLAAMLIHGEDFPSASNRITLHPNKKDQYGIPVPVVHYKHHPNSIKLRDYALSKARAMYQALGAAEVHDMIDVFPATHNMGTARMGTDPNRPAFATPGCENPTLTIVALALRQAQYIDKQLS